MKTKVCHMTSVHPAKDGRIFYKECRSLVNAGYDVSLIVAGAKSEICDGVKIIGVGGNYKDRLQRILKAGKDVYRKALEIDADIYHFHDPELLPYGLKLKKKGKKVIFDSHEDVPNQILEKSYMPLFFRKIIKLIYSKYEKYNLKKLNSLIGVSPHICERLKKINKNTYQITNYGFLNNVINNKIFNNQLCYVGPIRSQWCIEEILNSISLIKTNVSLILAGPAEREYLQKLENLSSWEKVTYLGKVKHEKVFEIYSNSSIGFALLKPSPNTDWHKGTLGNTKLFEIMASGIPVICTNFKLWENILNEYKCGISVNPENPKEISNAIEYLFLHPDESLKMGRNGRKAIIKEFNWETQEKILLQLYQNLIDEMDNSL